MRLKKRSRDRGRPRKNQRGVREENLFRNQGKVKSDRTDDLEAGASNSPKSKSKSNPSAMKSQRQEQNRPNISLIQRGVQKVKQYAVKPRTSRRRTDGAVTSSAGSRADARRDQSSPRRRRTAAARALQADAAEVAPPQKVRIPALGWTPPEELDLRDLDWS